MKGKSTAALMKHIRDAHKINISGTKHKNKLLQMGYYHGYKGYRFHKEKNHLFNFTDFDEIIAIYDFDTELKKLLLSPVLSLESSVKNLILDCLVTNSKATFEDVFSNQLTDYRRYTGPKQAKMLKEKLKLQKDIHTSIHMNYQRNNMVTSKIDSGSPLPIWVIFEIISLGKLGDFIHHMSVQSRIEILRKLNIYSSNDTIGSEITQHLLILNEFRNGMAHNHIIFDTRFKNRNIKDAIKTNIEVLVRTSNIQFESIVDYLTLVILYLKGLKYSKTELKNITIQFRKIVVRLSERIPASEFHKILGNDIFSKISDLQSFIST